MRQRYRAMEFPRLGYLSTTGKRGSILLQAPPVGELDKDVVVVLGQAAELVAKVVVVEAEEEDRAGAEDPAREQAAESLLVEEVVIDDGPERQRLAELVGGLLADDVVVPVPRAVGPVPEGLLAEVGPELEPLARLEGQGHAVGVAVAELGVLGVVVDAVAGL